MILGDADLSELVGEMRRLGIVSLTTPAITLHLTAEAPPSFVEPVLSADDRERLRIEAEKQAEADRKAAADEYDRVLGLQ